MQKPDLRRHQRILVPSGQRLRVHGNGGGPRLEGIVSAIGMGGMFIRTDSAPPPGTVLNLRLEDRVAAFDSECTVRYVEESGMGVEITSISSKGEQRLRFLLIQLKGPLHDPERL